MHATCLHFRLQRTSPPGRPLHWPEKGLTLTLVQLNCDLNQHNRYSCTELLVGTLLTLDDGIGGRRTPEQSLIRNIYFFFMATPIPSPEQEYARLQFVDAIRQSSEEEGTTVSDGAPRGSSDRGFGRPSPSKTREETHRFGDNLTMLQAEQSTFDQGGIKNPERCTALDLASSL